MVQDGWFGHEPSQAARPKHLLSSCLIRRDRDSMHSLNVGMPVVCSGNILLTQDGRAKIADFGFSKLNLKTATMCGGQGTLAWASPEQLCYEPCDSKSDIFSLGVVGLLHLNAATCSATAHPVGKFRDRVQPHAACTLYVHIFAWAAA